MAAGFVVRGGRRIAWQEFGAGNDVLLLMPTWSIVHSDFWRHQVPYFAERYRVIAFDGLGNGGSDRPTDPRMYGDLLVADDAMSVLDARDIGSAAVAGASLGAAWTLALAARHPERVNSAVFIAPDVPLAPGHPEFDAAERAFDDVLSAHEGWARWNGYYWLAQYEDFLRFFFSQCFTEPDSATHIDHFLAMGLETTPQVLLATAGTDEANLTANSAATYARQLNCPSLVIHGDQDAITPAARGERLARLAGSELVIMTGSGHEPQCRIPGVVNPLIDHFLRSAREQPPDRRRRRSWSPALLTDRTVPFCRPLDRWFRSLYGAARPE
jgi:pimeloyl-ACP methyl ester carboxylesterase